MSQVATGASAPQTKPTPIGCALLRGLIAGKPRSYQDREGNRAWATLLKLPAPDQYSSAQTVEVNSRAQLGSAGQEIEVLVRVGGSSRPFKYTDKDTGEPRQGLEVNIRLVQVEA